MHFIAVEVFICLFDYKTLFVCVIDGTCLRMAIPAYCFGIFSALFCLLMKKLGCKIRMWHDLTKYDKVSKSNLNCEYISSYGQRRNISFLKSAHWYGLNFLSLDLKIWT